MKLVQRDRGNDKVEPFEERLYQTDDRTYLLCWDTRDHDVLLMRYPVLINTIQECFSLKHHHHEDILIPWLERYLSDDEWKVIQEHPEPLILACEL